jgi:transposase
MKNSMKKLHKKISSHLKEDVKGYQKQRQHLKKEIKEDRDLMKKVKGNGRSGSY